MLALYSLSHQVIIIISSEKGVDFICAILNFPWSKKNFFVPCFVRLSLPWDLGVALRSFNWNDFESLSSNKKRVTFLLSQCIMD